MISEKQIANLKEIHQMIRNLKKIYIGEQNSELKKNNVQGHDPRL